MKLETKLQRVAKQLSEGKGWHKDSIPHSLARKTGSAMGTSTKREQYSDMLSGKISIPSQQPLSHRERELKLREQKLKLKKGELSWIKKQELAKEQKATQQEQAKQQERIQSEQLKEQEEEMGQRIQKEKAFLPPAHLAKRSYLKEKLEYEISKGHREKAEKIEKKLQKLESKESKLILKGVKKQHQIVKAIMRHERAEKVKAPFRAVGKTYKGLLGKGGYGEKPGFFYVKGGMQSAYSMSEHLPTHEEMKQKAGPNATLW